jgi:hypothetical protein
LVEGGGMAGSISLATAIFMAAAMLLCLFSMPSFYRSAFGRS